MGISELVMFAMMGHMAVLGTALGMLMVQGYWSLQLGKNLVICSTLFTEQEFKLVTYVAGPVKSTVDYIMIWLEDKAKVHEVSS